MSTQTQPAPVLPWHREAAKELVISCIVQPRNELFVAPTIARHDPHATTVRLLTCALSEIVITDEDGDVIHANARLVNKIRAHLAALQQEGAAK